MRMTKLPKRGFNKRGQSQSGTVEGNRVNGGIKPKTDNRSSE